MDLPKKGLVKAERASDWNKSRKFTAAYRFTLTHLRNWKNDKSVEPETFERPKVVRGYGTCVPHELPATDHKRLPRNVRQTKLQPQMAEMNGVHARAQHRHDGCQPSVHVQAGSPASSNRQRIEEKRVHGQRHPTR